MKRKGFIGDILLYLVLLFVLAIGLVVMYYIVSTFNTAWQAAPGIENEASDIMNEYNDRFIGIWDSWYLFLVIGFALVVIILGFAARTHPVFAMIGIFLIIIFGVISVYLANAYNSVATSEGLNTVAPAMAKTTYLAQYLPYIVVAIGILFVIIVFSKSQYSVNL